jgi:4-hydroxythreonine-4-phosphate dehydrogenase
LPLLLTQGDPAGIGPELTLKAWLARRPAGLSPFALVGDAAAARQAAGALGLAVALRECAPEDAAALFDTALPVLSSGSEVPVSVVPGRPDPRNASSTLAAIDTAAALIRAGRAAAMVTNPIAKSVLLRGRFRPSRSDRVPAGMHGAALGRTPLTGDDAVVAHARGGARHDPRPTQRVPELLTEDLIVETGRIVAHDLRTRFGVEKPRLALAGLNPHAGEGGALGLEDDAVVRPAVAKLQTLGIDARGPLPADTLFHERARARYDVALCMYHDQALIPIKTLAFDEGVNVTLGLPFIRTSPDHGWRSTSPVKAWRCPTA